MKISQDQKEANRKAVIDATAEIVADKGFKATTMRQIAKAAGMGEATIYNYFPTKEAILYAFYQEHMAACVDELKSIPEFHTFTFQEQLQTLFSTSLNLFIANREFVNRTFNLVMLGGSRNWNRIKAVRTAFLATVNDMLSAAAQAGEIPDQVFEELIGQFFLDAYIGVIHYWLADTSDGFANTHVLIDRGLDLACALLKAGVANKVFDIAVFLFKSHVLSRMEFLVEPLKGANLIKRRFMEQMHNE